MTPLLQVNIMMMINMISNRQLRGHHQQHNNITVIVAQDKKTMIAVRN